MAFIVKKKVNGKDYFYLNETHRKNGRVVSKCLGYLGKDRAEAETKAEEILKGRNDKVGGMEESSLAKKEISIEELSIFCKRKGFVYSSGEIYGGYSGFWDFGPLGVELKKNIKDEWWSSFVTKREDVVGIDGSIITHPLVWKASGHVDSFSDVFVLCKKCNKPSKIDRKDVGKIKCDCGGEFDVSSAKDFKLMFETNVGADSTAYLRPETAQLIFSNFKSVQENSRMKLPFGIAQIGKAFRNEISPRDFLFRSREFEQMELQFFIDPSEECGLYEDIKDKKINILLAEGEEKEMSIAEMLEKKIFKNKWHAYWLRLSYDWFLSLGIKKENIRLREHEKEELAHYAKAAVDIEYCFPNGFKEIFGSHDRGVFDLSQHEKHSKKELRVFDETKKEKILPHVIEASFGLDRAILAFMFEAMHKNSKDETVLKLNPKLSPMKAAVFPIIKREDYEKISQEILFELRKGWNVLYDKSGSIGRRYARNDEAGTPYCITIDEESLKGKDVTIRDRDTTRQIRVKISELRDTLRKLIDGEIEFEKAGKIVKS